MVRTIYFARLLTRWMTIALLLAALLFVAAGTTQIATIRIYLAVFSALLLSTMLAVSPELAAERAHRDQRDAQDLGRFTSGFLFLATVAIGALDVGRIHSGPELPAAAGAIGLLLFVLAMCLQLWAMAANPFFSPIIRLQRERGHRVVSSGPYRFVRHPGYLAMLICAPASALALGSWLALIPASMFGLAVVRRTRIEDAFLTAELPGYEAYVRSVQGRFSPFASRGKGVRNLFAAVMLSVAVMGSYKLRASLRLTPLPTLHELIPRGFCAVSPSVAAMETHMCTEK